MRSKTRASSRERDTNINFLSGGRIANRRKKDAQARRGHGRVGVPLKVQNSIGFWVCQRLNCATGRLRISWPLPFKDKAPNKLFSFHESHDAKLL